MTINKLKRWLFDRYLSLRYNYLILRLTEYCSTDVESRSISVAITSYNNSSLVHFSWFNLLKDSRVKEIVILDDGSAEIEFRKVLNKAKPFRSKIRIFRRSTNLGALATKIQVCELCSQDWILLLDCDNTYFRHSLDCLFGIKHWDKDLIYCAEFAYPHFKFEKFGKKIDLDINKVAEDYHLHSGYGTFLNDGNYFFERREFLKVMKQIQKYIVHASEVAFMNYVWLKSGKKLKIVGKLYYLHRVHAKSTFVINQRYSPEELKTLSSLLRDEIPIVQLDSYYPKLECEIDRATEY